MGKNIAVLVMITLIFILTPILGMLAPGLLGWFFIAVAVVLSLCVLYLLVKKAVKDALREYDEEKAKQNGPQ